MNRKITLLLVMILPLISMCTEQPQNYYEKDAKIPIKAIKCSEDGMYIWMSGEIVWKNKIAMSYNGIPLIIPFSKINPIFDVESMEEAYFIADIEEHENILYVVWVGMKEVHIPKEVWYEDC